MNNVIQLQEGCYFCGETYSDAKKYDTERTLVLDFATTILIDSKAKRYCNAIRKGKFKHAKVIKVSIVFAQEVK
jgi:hypothetical protein